MNSLERIRREVFGMRQAEFAEIAGASQTAVSRWESGESWPNLEQLVRIREEAFKRGFAWDDALFFDVATPLPAVEPIDEQDVSLSSPPASACDAAAATSGVLP